MTKKPVVLLDCDGVPSDFIGGVLEIVDDITGLSFERDDVDQFDFFQALGVSIDDGRAIKRAIAVPGFCESLQVYEGAKQGVKDLQEIADVYVVTAPWNSSPTWTYERESWLWRHFKIPHSHVIHTSAKHLVSGDAFVDDKTSAVEAWKIERPAGLAIRWETPHNIHEMWHGTGCRSWESLLDLVTNETAVR